MPEITNILMVGVGGQGILLASELLAEVLLRMNVDVKKSEIHGMAQRGGTVTSQIRYGERVFAPKIGLSQAHYILSFEYCESLRFLPLLAPDGIVLSNTQKIIPTTVSLGMSEYPQHIESFLAENKIRHEFIAAHTLAQKNGSLKSANLILLGFLNQKLKFPSELWFKVIRQKVKPKLVELNINAFTTGFEYRG